MTDRQVFPDPDSSPLKGRWDRLRAHVTAAIADHGIVRAIYQNRHMVAPGVYRSSQPSPSHLARLSRKGLRTVVNLRGRGHAGYYLLEREACGELGLTLIDFVVKSRDLPSREEVEAACDLFNSIEYPVLFHCKSGADRAGFMSALYLLVHENRPIEEALRQLSPRFGHWRQSKTGVLDRFFEVYRDYQKNNGGDFRRWLALAYDRDAIKRDFHDNRWVTVLLDRVLMRE